VRKVTLATLAGTSFALGVKAETLPKPETLFAPPSTLVQKTTEPLRDCTTGAYDLGETTPFKYTTITTDGITKEQCEKIHKKQSEKACGQATSIPPEKGRPVNARTAQTVWRTPDGKVVETVGFAGCPRENSGNSTPTKSLFAFTPVSTQSSPKPYDHNNPDGTCRIKGWKLRDTTESGSSEKIEEKTTYNECIKLDQSMKICNIPGVLASEAFFTNDPRPGDGHSATTQINNGRRCPVPAIK
jgi:hypothetical protein